VLGEIEGAIAVVASHETVIALTEGRLESPIDKVILIVSLEMGAYWFRLKV
jgi:hypothetical protein